MELDMKMWLDLKDGFIYNKFPMDKFTKFMNNMVSYYKKLNMDLYSYVIIGSNFSSIKKNIYIRFIINYNKTYKIDLIKYECLCPLNIKTIYFYNDNDKKSIETFYYVKKLIRTFIYLKSIFYYFNYYKFN